MRLSNDVHNREQCDSDHHSLIDVPQNHHFEGSLQGKLEETCERVSVKGRSLSVEDDLMCCLGNQEACEREIFQGTQCGVSLRKSRIDDKDGVTGSIRNQEAREREITNRKLGNGMIPPKSEAESKSDRRHGRMDCVARIMGRCVESFAEQRSGGVNDACALL